MKKLLLIGSNYIHTYNYYNLVCDYFDSVLLVVQKGKTPENISVVQLDFSLRNPVGVLRTIKSIHECIKTFKPSVIHIHQANSISFLTLIASRRYAIPTIITAWGSDVLFTPHSGWLYKKLVEYNLRNADYFTSDSQYMAEEMQRLMPSKKLDITIANFGINVNAEQVPKENIIYSNRLHKKLYRIDKVIEAFDRFQKIRKNEKWKLVIAGTGNETEKLRDLVHTLGREEDIEFIGWVNARLNSDYYNKATFFVSIPESDATAISLLEAMAAGCIPVVSDLPANREWITNRTNGIIVQDLSENFLEKAMGLNLDAVRKINNKIIMENGTKEANRKKFISLYEKILNENPG